MTPEEQKVIDNLRDQGYAIVIYHPLALKGQDATRIENDLEAYGDELVHNLYEVEG